MILVCIDELALVNFGNKTTNKSKECIQEFRGVSVYVEIAPSRGRAPGIVRRDEFAHTSFYLGV